MPSMYDSHYRTYTNITWTLLCHYGLTLQYCGPVLEHQTLRHIGYLNLVSGDLIW